MSGTFELLSVKARCFQPGLILFKFINPLWRLWYCPTVYCLKVMLFQCPLYLTILTVNNYMLIGIFQNICWDGEGIPWARPNLYDVVFCTFYISEEYKNILILYVKVEYTWVGVFLLICCLPSYQIFSLCLIMYSKLSSYCENCACDEVVLPKESGGRHNARSEWITPPVYS